MVGSEDDRESTFSGHAGRVLASAPLPLFGIALFGALGPFTELWKRSAYRSVPSEIYFTLPPVLDALLLGAGSLALWGLARREERAGRQQEHSPLAHQRLLRGTPVALFIAFAVAQMFGLLQVVDRTPAGFPWQFYLLLTLAALSAGVALTRRGLRLASWRCFTSQLSGHTALMLPGLSWPFAEAWGRQLDQHSPGLLAGFAWLSLVGLLWAGRRRLRWLDGAAVALGAATIVAAAPLFLSVRITREYVEHIEERCEVRLELGPIWRAGPGHDPVCEAGRLGAVSWGESALVGAVSLAALFGMLRRRWRRWPE